MPKQKRKHRERFPLVSLLNPGLTVCLFSYQEKECLARLPIKDLLTRVWQALQVFIYTRETAANFKEKT